MSATRDRRRFARDARVFAHVTFFKWSDGTKGDVRGSVHTAHVQLSCGHLVKKRIKRRLLIGERVRCASCEGVEPIAQHLAGLEWALTS